MSDSGSPVAVVTGGNRGLGLETCRQLGRTGYRVLLTARSPERGQRAAADLRSEGLSVAFQRLDVTESDHVEELAGLLEEERGRADVLVNNAGVYLDREAGALDVGLERVRRTMEVNAYGPLRLCQAVVPLMRRRGYGRVVNVSSGSGSFEEMGPGTLAYGASKAWLNVLTRKVALEVEGTGVLVNAACPGRVRTRMGGEEAPRTPEEGADTIVWLATLPEGGPTGGFFRDRERISW